MGVYLSISVLGRFSAGAAHKRASGHIFPSSVQQRLKLLGVRCLQLRWAMLGLYLSQITDLLFSHSWDMRLYDTQHQWVDFQWGLLWFQTVQDMHIKVIGDSNEAFPKAPAFVVFSEGDGTWLPALFSTRFTRFFLSKLEPKLWHQQIACYWLASLDESWQRLEPAVGNASVSFTISVNEVNGYMHTDAMVQWWGAGVSGCHVTMALLTKLNEFGL